MARRWPRGPVRAAAVRRTVSGTAPRSGPRSHREGKTHGEPRAGTARAEPRPPDPMSDHFRAVDSAPHQRLEDQHLELLVLAVGAELFDLRAVQSANDVEEAEEQGPGMREVIHR